MERLLGARERIAVGPQPRGSGADGEAARGAGEEIAGLLAEVGLAGIETRQLDLDPPTVLVIGTRNG
jgi:hypothetical protein